MIPLNLNRNSRREKGTGLKAETRLMKERVLRTCVQHDVYRDGIRKAMFLKGKKTETTVICTVKLLQCSAYTAWIHL